MGVAKLSEVILTPQLVYDKIEKTPLLIMLVLSHFCNVIFWCCTSLIQLVTTLTRLFE